MNEQSRRALFDLITSQRIASLGTVRDGVAMVTMVQCAPSAGFSSFYIHVSNLALHTQNIRRDPRVSLMVMETGSSRQNPQTLARISLSGTAGRIDKADARYEEAKAIYLGKNPEAVRNFTLSDFELFAIKPECARFIGGFGRIFDLDWEALMRQA